MTIQAARGFNEHPVVVVQKFADLEALRSESDQELAVRMCSPKSRIFSGGEIQLVATSQQFEELVRALVAKHSSKQASSGGVDIADPSDTQERALEWITSTIANNVQNREYGHVESEVVEEFLKSRANAPTGSPMDQAKRAMYACAHQ